MHFQNLWVLVLLPVAAAPVVPHFLRKKRDSAPGIRFPSDGLLKGLGTTFRIRLAFGAVFIRAAALVLIVVATAGPQSVTKESKIQTEGIDIVLAVDVSTSMLAEDFKLGGKRENRLEVVKDVVKEFINGRRNDRIGIVAFAARAYTVCPLTLDYGWLLRNLERLKIGMIEDGTAIGSGTSSALNRLKDTETKGKVVILLTDGRNNAGRISPLTAAETGSALKIKIYTIGAGTKDLAPYPVKDFFGNTVYRPVKIDIDEDVLIKIAAKTDAKYFRATDTKSLRKIYREIDRLEKTKIEEKFFFEYRELFHLFLIPGVALLFIGIVLSNTVLRKLP